MCLFHRNRFTTSCKARLKFSFCNVLFDFDSFRLKFIERVKKNHLLSCVKFEHNRLHCLVLRICHFFHTFSLMFRLPSFTKYTTVFKTVLRVVSIQHS